LVFEVFPAIFKNMPFGTIVGVVFFVLLSIAALTSTISLLEVPTAYFVDEKGVARKIAVWMVGIIVFLIGLPSALSQGAVRFLSKPIAGGMEFLSLMDFIWGNLSLAVGAFLMSIFVGWIWGVKHAARELTLGYPQFARWTFIWGFLIRFLVPISIFIILINLFQIF
jgi:NSS family neurotransmitter:Na+ symporter